MEASNKLIRFDWFIKKMLRNKSDFKVLEGLLSALLKKEIVILNLLESEGNSDSEVNKFNRVDILVEDENKEKIIVEIQNERESDYLERILFGSSKVITDYFKLGTKYKEITKVISVSILYFNLGGGDDYIYHGSTEFYGIHTKEKLKVKSRIVKVDAFGKDKISYEGKPNIFPEYYLINVEKFTNKVEEDIDEWIYMLKNSEIKKEFKSKYIKEAEIHLNLEKLDKNEKRAYEKHLESIVIEEDIMKTAKDEGFEEGIEQGIKKGIETGIERGIEKEKLRIIENAKQLNLSIEQISDLTGLTIDKIKELYGY